MSEFLFSRRMERLEEEAARARGENVDYLVHDVPDAFRQQVVYALEDAAGSTPTDTWESGLQLTSRSVREFLVREYGVASLAGISDPSADVAAFVKRSADTRGVMDVIGTAVQAGRVYGAAVFNSDDFIERVNGYLRRHKLAYEIVADVVVPKDAEELHQEVVSPTLTLLHGRPGFEGVERQYLEALDELSKGNWSDAVTDANAAVESTLRVLLGYEEGQLPGLLGEARKRGLLGPREDRRLKDFVRGLTALSDARNEKGDAHGGVADEETAWLAIHWAGALILFLVRRASRPDPRG